MSVTIESFGLTQYIIRSFGGRQALFLLISIDSFDVWLLNLASSVVSGAHEEKQEYCTMYSELIQLIRILASISYARHVDYPSWVIGLQTFLDRGTD